MQLMSSISSVADLLAYSPENFCRWQCDSVSLTSKNKLGLSFARRQHHNADNCSDEPTFNIEYQFNIATENIFVGGGLNSIGDF